MLLVDCGYGTLGHLAPLDFHDENQIVTKRPAATVINGKLIPEHVAEELRILGMPLAFFSHGELEDAIIACHHDRKLVDDHQGHHFRDKLTLSHEEKLKRSRNAHTKNPHQSEEHCPLFW